MRKLTIFATGIALLFSTGSANQACAQWPQTTFKDSRMSVEIGAAAYDRPGVDSQAPVVSSSLTGATLFSAEQASDLGTNFGAQVKLNFVNRRDREIEIRSILAGWDEQQVINRADLVSGFFPDPTAAPTTFEYDYESDYFSIEVMRRRAIVPGVTIMAGPRFVSTSDLIVARGSRDVATVTVSETQTFEATNALIGLQGGLELNFPVTQSIYANGFIRAGGYFNPTEFNTMTENSLTSVTTSTRRDDSIESFLAEAGGRVYVDLLPNCISSYVGYEATWIDGIAVATANAGTTGPGIDTANTIFFHAVTFGVQMTY